MTYIKLPSFTHVAYRDEEVKKQLEPIIKWADSRLHEIEFRLIKEGVRHCNYFYIDPLRPDLSLVYKYGLKYKVIASVKKFEGFAHTHEQPQSLEETWFFAAACDTEENAEKMAKAYVEADHETQGRLLGYPEDDIKFFLTWWGRHLDLVYPAALNSESIEIGGRRAVKFDPRLNVALRYTGLRVIPFFPHSFNCPDAAKFADVVVKLLKEDDGEMTDKLLEILSKPYRFSQVNGIIQVDVFEKPFERWLFTIITGGYSDEDYEFYAVGQ